MTFSYKHPKPRKKNSDYLYYFCGVVLVGCSLYSLPVKERNMMHDNSIQANKSSNMRYQQTEQGKLDENRLLSSFLKYQVLYSSTGDYMTMKQWAEALFNDYESFNTLLSSCPYSAFFWECAPTTDGSNRMEFVLVDAPDLAQFARSSPDRLAFQSHFSSSSEEPFVAVFPSLGKDALLLAPNTQSTEPFTDIAWFTRHASAEQRKALYQLLAQVLQEQIKKCDLYKKDILVVHVGNGDCLDAHSC